MSPGSVYDFVAEDFGAGWNTWRYHEIPHLVATDPSDKISMSSAKGREMLDHYGLQWAGNRINEVLAQLGTEADMQLSALGGS